MGTLVSDPFYVDVPAFFGMSLEELIAVKHPDAWVQFEFDRIDEAQMLASFFADGRAYDHAGLVATMRQGYGWLPGIQALLVELAAAGIEMHTLSNYPSWYRLIEDRLRVSEHLPWTFVSCITGLRKPDPATYRHASAALGVGADEVIFVDDRADNCDAARKVGMGAIHFSDAGQLRRQLQARTWLQGQAPA